MAVANSGSDETAPNKIIDEQNFKSSGLPRISRIALPSTALTTAAQSLIRDPRTLCPQ
jgi:hypothetical protein